MKMNHNQGQDSTKNSETSDLHDIWRKGLVGKWERWFSRGGSGLYEKGCSMPSARGLPLLA